MRQYVETIARFFHNAKLAIALLEDYEYEIISELATKWYYSELRLYPANGDYRE